jgi:hypothetical protein
MRSGGSGQRCLRNSAGDDASNRLATGLTVGRGIGSAFWGKSRRSQESRFHTPSRMSGKGRKVAQGGGKVIAK